MISSIERLGVMKLLLMEFGGQPNAQQIQAATPKGQENIPWK